MKLYNFPPMLGPAEEWPEGSPEYAVRLGNKLGYMARNASRFGVDPLIPVVRKAINVEPWLVWPEPPEGPCGSVDAYFQMCTGYTYREITTAIIGLSHDPALARELNVVKGQADSVTRQGERKDLNELHVNHMRLSQGSGNIAYILRRLARAGRADLLERYKAGELSANAAALAAGFRKQPTPFQTILKLLPKLSPEERQRLHEETASQ